MMDDQSLIEAIDEFENDRVLAETAEALERQVNYQTQIGGNPLAYGVPSPPKIKVVTQGKIG